MSVYSDGARRLQDQFDSRRLADRLEQVKVTDHIQPPQKVFIEARDMFFLATVDARGHANCSYKGGAPGIVRVLDARTVAFPSQDGNGMHLSLGAMVETGEVGLLFLDFEAQERLRLNGKATIDAKDPLLASWPEAQVVVRVAVREVFPNCGRYIHRYTLAERSGFVPSAGGVTPVPQWKRDAWAADALPEGDPARDPTRQAKKR